MGDLDSFEGFRFNNQFNLADAYAVGIHFYNLSSVAQNSREISKIYDSLNQIHSILESREIELESIEQIEQFKEAYRQRAEQGETELEQGDVNDLLEFLNYWNKEIKNWMIDESRIPINKEGLLLDMEGAIETPEELFNNRVWNSMPKRTKRDIREACRSLAVDCPTSSMFIALRAVEDRLRDFYEQKTGESIEQAWGGVLDELDDYYEGKNQKPSLLDHLQYLKDKRNAISHPDHSPDLDEARKTLVRVSGTIEDIYKETGQEKEDKQPENPSLTVSADVAKEEIEQKIQDLMNERAASTSLDSFETENKKDEDLETEDE